MAFRQKVYFPPRIALSGTVSRNLIQQLEFSEYTEEVELEIYSKNGVSGWTLKKKNGESVLVVPKETTAKFKGSILLLPDISTIPSSKDDSVDRQKWLLPKLKKIGSDIDLTKICSEVHSSWENNFNFIKELRTNGNIERYGLRPPQLGALHACLAHWTVTEEIATIVMPTGTGKTETMLALLASERLRKLLVIVPTNALREQIFEKFLTFGILQKFGILNRDAKLPVVGNIKHCFKTVDEVNLYMASCNVAVSTMGVISSSSKEVQEAIASQCSHIFFDEAHHIAAQTWNYFRELAKDYEKPILQFTATPFRNDGKHIGGKSIFTYPLRKAQEEEYFKKIKFISVSEYNLGIADKTIAQSAIQVLKEDLQNQYDHLLMARTKTINRSKEVHAIYIALAPEYNPLIIHSKLNESEKAQALYKLKARESLIIVCVDMLGEGFDLPQLKIAALHDIHKSLAVTIWIKWCKHIGSKLLDSSISTEQILEQSIIPEKISERPNLVPIAIDWSPYFYARSDEAVQIEINGTVESFYLAELTITTFSDQGFLCFSISLEGVQIEYEIIFKENIVTYIQLDNAEVNLCVSDKKESLSKWFQVEPPIIRFEDTSVLKYDEIYRPKNNREPYDKSKIECWQWKDIDIKKESQYKANASSNNLILRQDSIQHKVIESLEQENDIVFDDDGAGEIADIVTLKKDSTLLSISSKDKLEFTMLDNLFES